MRHGDLSCYPLPGLSSACDRRDCYSQISNLDLPSCKLIRFLPVLSRGGHGGRSIGLFSITTSDRSEKTRSHLPLSPSGPAGRHSEVCRELCLAPHKMPSPARQGEELVCRSAPSLSCCSESSTGGLKSPSLRDAAWGRTREPISDRPDGLGISLGNRKTPKGSIQALLAVRAHGCISPHPCISPTERPASGCPGPGLLPPPGKVGARAGSSGCVPCRYPCHRGSAPPQRWGCQNKSERLAQERCYLYPEGLMSTRSKGEHNGERQELDYRGVFLERAGGCV